MLMKARGLLLACAVGLSVGCGAIHRGDDIKCRFTRLDAKFNPIPPHDVWVKGMDACMTEIKVLAEEGAPETVGVEARGSMAMRKKLHDRIMVRPRHEIRDEEISKIVFNVNVKGLSRR